MINVSLKMQSPSLGTAKDLLLHVADEANINIGISYKKSRTIFANIDNNRS